MIFGLFAKGLALLLGPILSCFYFDDFRAFCKGVSLAFGSHFILFLI